LSFMWLLRVHYQDEDFYTITFCDLSRLLLPKKQDYVIAREANQSWIVKVPQILSIYLQ
jgi:hypothetical protein